MLAAFIGTPTSRIAFATGSGRAARVVVGTNKNTAINVMSMDLGMSKLSVIVGGDRLQLAAPHNNCSNTY